MDSPLLQEEGQSEQPLHYLSPDNVRENFSGSYNLTRRQQLQFVVRKAGTGAALLWRLFCRVFVALLGTVKRLWFVLSVSAPRSGGNQRQRQSKFDAPLNFVIILVFAFLLLMSVMLLSPTPYHREEPDPSRPLTMVSYYQHERMQQKNQELQDCASGYGMREKTFNADVCVQRFQRQLSAAGWSEATLKYQEDRLLQREKLPCLCSPMYGSSFPRLTLRTKVDSNLHCAAPRLTLMKKGQAVITEKSQLLSKEGRRVVRATHISLYCLQTHSLQSSSSKDVVVGNDTTGGVEYVGEEIFRHVSDQEAFCVQFCLELLTGANLSQQQ